MISEPIGPDVVVLRDDTERCVLVCGTRYTTAIDLPTRPKNLAALLHASADLTAEGLHTAILTHEQDGLAPVLEQVGGVQLVRADRRPGDDEWEWDDVPSELLQLPTVPVRLIRQPQTVTDDTGRVFNVEPCLGSATSLAVFVEPEGILVCCDDLDPTLPPRIHPGHVHETIMRLEDWRLRAPNIIVPASGVPLRGDVAIGMLDRSTSYLRALYQQTRVGLVESRLPWERLVYMIPLGSVWPIENAARTAIDRHKENVREMAQDIFQRLQAEADEVSIAT